MTRDEYNLLMIRIIETCKHTNSDFTINSKQLTDNINLIFNTTYSVKEINYVLGELYENAFHYTTQQQKEVQHNDI